MENYLSGRGSNLEGSNLNNHEDEFSPYLSGNNSADLNSSTDDDEELDKNKEKSLIHSDETGIKVEVVSVDGNPSNILIHIPDGRIIDLSCEY
jgi:hypothetical protein